MHNLDEKDCIILNLLQENCRMSLTDISKKVDLSVDSTKKRIKKMENVFFHPKIQVRPWAVGFPNVVEVKIKFNNHSQDKIGEFISYLMDNPRVAEIFSVSGEWDLSIVVISKDLDDFAKQVSDIKGNFGDIINSWTESTTLKSHKFERYDMLKLLGFNK